MAMPKLAIDVLPRRTWPFQHSDRAYEVRATMHASGAVTVCVLDHNVAFQPLGYEDHPVRGPVPIESIRLELPPGLDRRQFFDSEVISDAMVRAEQCAREHIE